MRTKCKKITKIKINEISQIGVELIDRSYSAILKHQRDGIAEPVVQALANLHSYAAELKDIKKKYNKEKINNKLETLEDIKKDREVN